MLEEADIGLSTEVPVVVVVVVEVVVVMATAESVKAARVVKAMSDVPATKPFA